MSVTPSRWNLRMVRETVDRRVAAFASLHHGVFTMGQLSELRVSADHRRRRLESGRWTEIYDGVYSITGVPDRWTSGLLAAVWAGGGRALASHRSAAALWELPGSRHDIFEITCPRWRRTQEAGLVVHESKALTPTDAAVVDGIPVTSVERTIFDLCGVYRSTAIDIAIDSAIRRELTNVEQLESTLARLARRGRSGTQRLRRVLAERSPVTALTANERERLLFDMLRRHDFPPPVPQYEIRDETGNLIARPDFAYPDLKIAIEYDSVQEHTGKMALFRDSARRNSVVALGWAPIAATLVDLRQGGSALASALRRARNRRIAESAS
jgi:predicted transcriptional regulator of viral defense system